MKKNKRIIGFLLAQIIGKYSVYSLEKIILESIKYNPLLKKEMDAEISLLKKGVPANKLLKITQKNYRDYYEIIELITDLPNIARKVKQSIDKIFNSLYEINQAFEEITNYFNSLEKKLLLLNFSLALIYGILPWLINFTIVSHNFLLSEKNTYLLSLIIPNIYIITYYYILTVIIVFFIMRIIYGYSNIIKHEIFSSVTYFLIQIILFFTLLHIVA
jgi:hypothetical protein